MCVNYLIITVKNPQSNYCRFFFDFGRFIYNRSNTTRQNTVVFSRFNLNFYRKKTPKISKAAGMKIKVFKRTGSGRYLSAVYPSSHRFTSTYRCLRAYSYWNTRQRKVPDHHLRQLSFSHHETRRICMWQLKCRGLSQERELCCGRTDDGVGKHQDHVSSLGSRVRSITKTEKNPSTLLF